MFPLKPVLIPKAQRFGSRRENTESCTEFFVCKVFTIFYFSDLLDLLGSHFLQSSDFSAANVVSILDAFPSEDHVRAWLEAYGDSKAVTVWACNRGGVTAIRSSTRRMPDVASFLTSCVKLVAPDCEFTSVSVHRNLQAPMHQDSFNSSVPNVIVPVSSFTGGQIFVVHPEGPDQASYDNATWTGFELDCASHAWAFDAKHCKHFTQPWHARIQDSFGCIFGRTSFGFIP